MRKGQLLRSVLALGMVFSLAAAPLGFAETVDETEYVKDVQAAVEETISDSLEEFTSAAYDGFVNVTFGDGLYDIVGMNGTDISWLKDVSAYGVFAPGEETIDGELILMLNNTVLGDARICVNPSDGKIFFSVPQLFDQPVAVDIQSLTKKSAGSSADGSGDDSDIGGKIMEILVNIGVEMAGQFVDVFKSISADVWQEELTNYLMPIMSRLGQESGEDVIMVGDLSADVETQTYSIPSKEMSGLITDTLSAAANDQIVEKVLQSDVVTDVLGFVSMFTGESSVSSGQELLDLYRSVIESVAEADFSGIPGFSVTIMNGTDKNASGQIVSVEADGQSYDYYTVKTIVDGNENAFEYIPGQMMLSMYGMDPSTEIRIAGEGSTEGGFLNETVDLTVNDEVVATFAIEDFDLTAIQDGTLSGTFRFDMEGMNLKVEYSEDEYGTSCIDYTVNDELFYHADYFGEKIDNPELSEIDVDNAVEISSLEDVLDWIGTFKIEEFMETLAEAGVPLESEDTVAA